MRHSTLEAEAYEAGYRAALKATNDALNRTQEMQDGARDHMDRADEVAAFYPRLARRWFITGALLTGTAWIWVEVIL